MVTLKYLTHVVEQSLQFTNTFCMNRPQLLLHCSCFVFCCVGSTWFLISRLVIITIQPHFFFPVGDDLAFPVCLTHCFSRPARPSGLHILREVSPSEIISHWKAGHSFILLLFFSHLYFGKFQPAEM